MNFSYGSHSVTLVSLCTFCGFTSQKNQLALSYLDRWPFKFRSIAKFFLFTTVVDKQLKDKYSAKR